MSENHPLIRALSPLLRRVRTDVTAVKKPNGESAWTRDALTKAMVAKHLTGGPSRGTSFIKAGQSTSLVIALDFDSHGGETPLVEMLAVAKRVADMAALFGLYAIGFVSSGGRGVHLYFIFDTPQDAYSSRATLIDVLAACSLFNGTKGVAQGQVEVFPKQDMVPIDGFGNQMVLPLAGKSVPIDTTTFEPMARDWAITQPWPVSEPVGVREREARALVAATAAQRVSIDLLRSAAAAIPNEGDAAPDYDEWYRVICAIHEGSGGSDEGLELAVEFSARNPKHDDKFFRERVWPYIKSRAGGVGHKTLFMKARASGWVEPYELAFDDLDKEQDDAQENDSPHPAAAGPGAGGADLARGVVDLAGGVGDLAGKNATEKPLAKAARPRPLPGLPRDKQNKIDVTAPHMLAAVSCPELTGGAIGYDAFRDEIMIDEAQAGQWRPLVDADYFWIRERLERHGFKVIGKEAIRDAVGAVASRNTFDSAQLWLDTLTWDGVERIDSFLPTYLGTEDSPYTRAVSAYMWTALAGRVLVPGCKADMVPIMVGAQGQGKSTAVSAMVPGPEFFTEVNFTEREDDMARKMRGKLIAEFGELHGFHTRANEAIKAFTTRTHEQWVPKFKEFATSFPRRLLFIGTTNQAQFLADDTGNRRWLPFHTGIVDVASIRRDHLQLWAEAAVRHQTWGVMWQEAEQLARAQHVQHEMDDSWDERVATWLSTPEFGEGPMPCDARYLTTSHVLVGALGFDAKHISRREEMRVASVLRRLGYKRTQLRVDKYPTWVYVTTRHHLVPTSLDEVVTP